MLSLDNKERTLSAISDEGGFCCSYTYLRVEKIFFYDALFISILNSHSSKITITIPSSSLLEAGSSTGTLIHFKTSRKRSVARTMPSLKPSSESLCPAPATNSNSTSSSGHPACFKALAKRHAAWGCQT